METGLEDYEVSRACRFLQKSGLITVARWQNDARIRVLAATAQGRHIHERVILAAARRLKAGTPAAGRQRRLSEATESFRNGQQILGPLQLSFFDRDYFDEDPPTLTKATRNITKATRGRSR
jgi:DNA-binding MarR family transcriptional regulator